MSANEMVYAHRQRERPTLVLFFSVEKHFLFVARGFSYPLYVFGRGWGFGETKVVARGFLKDYLGRWSPRIWDQLGRLLLMSLKDYT